MLPCSLLEVRPLESRSILDTRLHLTARVHLTAWEKQVGHLGLCSEALLCARCLDRDKHSHDAALSCLGFGEEDVTLHFGSCICQQLWKAPSPPLLALNQQRPGCSSKPAQLPRQPDFLMFFFFFFNNYYLETDYSPLYNLGFSWIDHYLLFCVFKD